MKKNGVTLLCRLNDKYPRIRFNPDEEESGHPPFMDICFTQQQNGSLARDVYQKPTHTNGYMSFNSHHSMSFKAGIVQGLVDRVINVCSDEKRRKREFEGILEAMTNTGYPKCFTERAITKQIKKGLASRVEEMFDEADQLK